MANPYGIKEFQLHDDLQAKLADLVSGLLDKLPKGAYTGTASDLEAEIVAMGTSVKGDKITPSTTPAGTGVGAWLIAEAGTYIGGNVLPANSLGFLLRNASNAYSVTYTSIVLDYASNQDVQRLGRSLVNEQINYINPSLGLGGLLNFPVNNWLFIPSQNVLKDGHLLSLSVPLINAQTGRTVRFQVLEKTGANDFKLKFQTDAILAETAGTFNYNLPNSFKVLAGYYIGAIVTTSNTANSIGTATLISTEYGAASSAFTYTDTPLAVGTYYYWFRSRNVSGVEGTAVASGAKTVT